MIQGEELEFSSEMFRQVLTFKVGGLAGDLGGFLSGPTAQNLRTMDELRKEVPAAVQFSVPSISTVVVRQCGIDPLATHAPACD